MNRQGVVRLNNQPPLAIRNGCRMIVALLNIRREGTAHQCQVALVGNGSQSIPADLDGDRIQAPSLTHGRAPLSCSSLHRPADASWEAEGSLNRTAELMPVHPVLYSPAYGTADRPACGAFLPLKTRFRPSRFLPGAQWVPRRQRHSWSKTSQHAPVR